MTDSSSDSSVTIIMQGGSSPFTYSWFNIAEYHLYFTYGFEFTVSRMAVITGGAHEFSLTLNFGKVVKRTRYDTISPCFGY